MHGGHDLECAANGGALAFGRFADAIRRSLSTVNCEESQSGSVAAALQISILCQCHLHVEDLQMGEQHEE